MKDENQSTRRISTLLKCNVAIEFRESWIWRSSWRCFELWRSNFGRVQDKMITIRTLPSSSSSLASEPRSDIKAFSEPIWPQTVRIFLKMAETAASPASSGVTEADIKSILTDKMGATHVEISDISGILPL